MTEVGKLAFVFLLLAVMATALLFAPSEAITATLG